MIRVFFVTGFLAMKLALFAQTYDAELLSYNTHTEVSEGKLVRNTQLRVQINNRAGDKYASVSIPFSSSDKLSKIEGSIEDRHGRVVRKLKKGDISERSDIARMSLYEDDYLREFTLKHNSYPYIITYSYQIQQGEYIYVDYWVPVLNRNIPTLQAKLTVSAPVDFEISYAGNRLKEFQVDTMETMIRYTWKTDYKKPLKEEELAPPILDYLPTVKVVPLNFNFELNGSFRSWTDYGNWEWALLDGMQELPESEIGKIKSLAEGMDDEREKINALYHYLQDGTRYVNVSIETGGLKPYPASYVAENKYGDCKALSNYFMAVLQAAGIPSFYTNVNAGEPIRKINKSFPAQQFNHVILFIPLAQDTVWLDCTSDGAFDYLGTFTQNREALVIAENESRFIRTPALTKEDVLETRCIRVPFEPYSDAAVDFRNSYRGDMYEMLVELDEGYGLNDKARILRNYIIEDGFELIDYSLQQSHRDSALMYLSYKANTAQIYEHYGRDILVNNIPFQVPDLEEPGDRILPVQLDYPIFRIDTISYQIPKGYEISIPQSNQVVSSDLGAYSMEFYQKENSIEVVKKLEVHPGFYEQEQYRNFYEFMHEINTIEHKIFITLTLP